MARDHRSMCRVSHLLALAVALPAVPSRAGEPFDYFQNSWSVIGLKDYRHGTRVTPDNDLLLAGGRKVRVRYGRRLARLRREQTKTLLDGWLPVVQLAAEDEKVRYEFALWATPLPTVKDWRKAFDWPTEGENFLNWIVVTITNASLTPAEAKLKVEPGDLPASVSGPLAWSLSPGQSVEAVLRIPFEPLPDTSVLAAEDPRLWLDRTVEYWRGIMAGAARITVPCEKATQSLLAAHVCQLIANDHGELRGGEGFYDEFYIRDGGYQILELEEAGLKDAARKAVDRYLAYQLPEGRFETQKGQLDANGQALWVLWQFYKITQDSTWLEGAYPQMRRAVDWMMQARRQAPADSPFAGLLPAAVADGEYLWDGKHHIVGYDFWNLRGSLCTADAAAALGKAGEADELRREAGLYRAAVDAAWQRTGLPHFPPSWEKAGTHWGDTELLWPTELFAPDDPRVTALLTEVRKRHGGGFVEGTIRWTGFPDVIHPYMSVYSTMALLVRGEHEKVVEEFTWYLLHSTATHAFPEGIYFKRRFAWSDTIPHCTGAANYAALLRHMLIHERGDELHLLPAVPDAWLADGQEIRIRSAPTHFGELNLRTRGLAAGVQVEFDPPRRTPPRRVVLHLPASRPMAAPQPNVEVAQRPDQTKPWDFPTVVRMYLEHAPPLVLRIPGLVDLPLERALVPEQCRMLDLAPLANTDPLAAPFGVPNPGKFLFTGLPVGVQTAGGVPFNIIDPAANHGRGFVVLHSPRAPADREWPRQMEIAVNEKGRRLFFLGNVHGWSVDDAGAGPWGAVAEYVIHYTDGQTQTVPLITGCTIEDWTADPAATDAPCGLRGEPWHLNVLGVELHAVPIEKIVFRDLDTAAAPLLAAVTLEK